MTALQARLDAEVALRNSISELSAQKPDPLMIARTTRDECHALTCALFAYGNVQSIVAFLGSLQPSWIDANEEQIRDSTQGKYYRFQNSEDIAQRHITLGRLKAHWGVEETFERGYRNDGVFGGISFLIETIYDLNSLSSQGLKFLI